MGDCLATIDMNRKLGAAVPRFGGALDPMWPGPRPTSVPSGILIYPAFWLQQTCADNRGGAVPPFWRGWSWVSI